MPVHDSQIILCNRKISTYVNALAKAEFPYALRHEKFKNTDIFSQILKSKKTKHSLKKQRLNHDKHSK